MAYLENTHLRMSNIHGIIFSNLFIDPQYTPARIMDLTSALLVLIIIILVVALYLRPVAASANTTDTWDCVNRNTGDISSVAINSVRGSSKAASPEASATKETIEHFQGCDNGPKTADIDGECTNGDLTYAVNEYGSPGMSYKDWVAAQAIDPAVIQNHNEYVADRAGTDWSQSATGRTWAFPDNESYEPTTWSGIRGRPQRVPVCNPTEVVDDDINWYPAKQRLRW